MSDDKNKTAHDRNFINVNEDYEVEYWTQELGISKQQLMDAVQQVVLVYKRFVSLSASN